MIMPFSTLEHAFVRSTASKRTWQMLHIGGGAGGEGGGGEGGGGGGDGNGGDGGRGDDGDGDAGGDGGGNNGDGGGGVGGSSRRMIVDAAVATAEDTAA